MLDEIENILTRNYKHDMVLFFQKNPDRIDDLIKLIFEKNNPLSWRAAWLLWSCVPKNDSRILENTSRFISILPYSNESMQREILKILFNIDLEEESLGRLINICINIWEDINKRPGVRYSSFRMLLKISKEYPELENELGYLVDERFINTLSPGIKHSIKKLIKLNKIK